METVAAAVAAYREQPAGAGRGPFRLSSTLEGPADVAEVERAWPGRRLPEQLAQLWAAARRARLFVDVDHGQWGLVLLSPAESAGRTQVERRARPGDLRSDDIVVGEFLGDQELVVVAGVDDRHQVLVALPLDDRADWPVAAEDLAQFLTRYLECGGDKYWERGSPG